MKKILMLSVLILFLISCAGISPEPNPVIHEVKLRIEGVNSVKVSEDGIVRTMEVSNEAGTLSGMGFIAGDEAYFKLFSSLTVGDVSNLWNDFCILRKTTDIRKINLFINSPGGDAFSGLALADQIERAKREGFRITAYASGIVASAAVPVFAVCDERLAAPGTIFMVHETSIWKWPGRETASDIRSQGRLMDMIRDRYLEKLATNSNLSVVEWGKMEGDTTWFSVKQAKAWGLVDKIE